MPIQGSSQTNQPAVANSPTATSPTATSISMRQGLSMRQGFRPLALSGLAVATGIAFTFGQSPIGTNQLQAQTPIQSLQVPAGATVLHVNPTLGTDAGGRGTEATPLKTIAYALEQANGTTPTVIQLASGSYTADNGERFPLKLKPNVTLLGNEASKGQGVVIVGGGTIISPSFASQNVAILAANNSVVRGVTVTNPNSRGTGIWVESTNPVIANSNFVGSNRDGILITGTGNPLVGSNIFTKNSGNGVAIARSATGTVANNLFQDNGFGLAIGDTATTMIQNNQVVKNISGIYINGSARPVLRNNAITGNSENGIVITTNGNPDLGTTASNGGNIIRNNNSSGRSSVYDIYNATQNTIAAVGNDVDKISGPVDFSAAPVPTPTPIPTHATS
ncbi:MAG: DUF1565 domain-containing protein [Alkalinema sp. RL_2_19]|nr:DUF1565 domain-containing protein [Alkalinema sp. RL_2_19]